MAALSTCMDPTCAVALEGKAERCPKCGGRMRMVGSGSRPRGVLLLICGLILVGMMGPILWLLAPSMLDPGADTDGAGFSGTVEQGRIIIGLFATIIVFGLVAIAGGLQMIVSNHQSRGFTIVTLALAGVMMLVAFAIMFKLV